MPLRSNFVLYEQTKGSSASLTVSSDPEAPVKIAVRDGGYTTSIELDYRQVSQLMHFLNIIVETA